MVRSMSEMVVARRVGRVVVQALGVAALFTLPASLAAQRAPQQQLPAGAAAAASAGMSEQVAMAVEESMNAHMNGPHLDLTPLRKVAPGDSARAAKVAAELRKGIAK